MARKFTPNKVRQDGDTAWLQLNRELETAVEISDLASVAEWHWHAIYNTTVRGYYVITHMPGETRSGTRTVYLHRFLMGEPPAKKVDHQDGDTLNNRRSNLRLATTKENLENRRNKANTNSKTGIRGVSVHQTYNRDKTPHKKYYVARVHDANGKGKAKYFPYTPEGLARAAEAAKAIREEVFTHSDGR